MFPWPHAKTNGYWKRSEEHTSELQSQSNLVCRLLLEKKKSYHQPRIMFLTARKGAEPAPDKEPSKEYHKNEQEHLPRAQHDEVPPPPPQVSARAIRMH